MDPLDPCVLDPENFPADGVNCQSKQHLLPPDNRVSMVWGGEEYVVLCHLLTEHGSRCLSLKASLGQALTTAYSQL